MSKSAPPPEDVPRSPTGRIPQWVLDEAVGTHTEFSSWRTAPPPTPGPAPLSRRRRRMPTWAWIALALVAVGAAVAVSVVVVRGR